ncbi:hypothetical protein QEM27_000473 [Pseudomonas putida]|nr:hypothetical protein [Pseudomonas putida]EKT8866250.1 hypothetical protein [Pseudomonas putida]
MGIELDVLVGHPEHDLMFVATQVAEASGLKNAKSSVSNIRIAHKLGQQLGTLVQDQCISLPIDASGRRLRSNAVLFSEPEVYRMLMTGHAPQSEPFRKWVTEEVLPTIRKTGQYNAAESSDPIALGIMGGDVAKPLTMAALPQRPQEDHKHDQLRPSPARGDHHRCTLRSQAWPGPTHQDHRQLILWLHRADHRLRSISPLRNGHP